MTVLTYCSSGFHLKLNTSSVFFPGGFTREITPTPSPQTGSFLEDTGTGITCSFPTFTEGPADWYQPRGGDLKVTEKYIVVKLYRMDKWKVCIFTVFTLFKIESL